MRRISRGIVQIPVALLFCLWVEAGATIPTAASVHELVQSGSLEKVKAFLATPGVDVNDRYVVGELQDDIEMDMEDCSLLDFAAEANQVNLASYLIEHGARVNDRQLQGRNRGLAAIHRAAYFDAADVAELLIAHGANVNTDEGHIFRRLGATPLIYAAANGSLKSAAVLLRHGADASASTVDGGTALSEGSHSPHPEVTKLISAALDSPLVVDLVDAARNGDLDAVQAALAKPAQHAEVDVALRFALMAGNDHRRARQKIVDLLLSRGGHVIQNGASLLALAITPEVATLLLEHGGDPKSPRLRAAAAQSVACNPVVADPVGTLKVLIEHGTSLKTFPDAARAMLRCAIVARRADLAEFLIQQGAHPDTLDAAGRTLLFDAANSEMVNLLLQYKTPLDVVDVAHDTALGVAIAAPHTGAAVALVSAGAVEGPAATDYLREAIHFKQSSVTVALLSKGVEFRTRDADGRSALFWAVAAQDGAAAQMLIDRGADVNARDRSGATPLHVAAQANDMWLVSTLMRSHANAAMPNNKGQLPRDLTTVENIRKLLTVPSKPWDRELPKEDAKACDEVARRAGEGTLGRIVAFGEAARAARDPSDNWALLDQVRGGMQISLSGRKYTLGTDPGPVYLSHVNEAGTESVVCEFARVADSEPATYRVLGPGERLTGDLQKQ